MSQFAPIPYADLNSRQKENYNFHKVAARMADYGFNCLRLTDDWQGADFIACHIDSETFLKVQLKGRLLVDKKYVGKGIHIAFLSGDDCYVYDHDAFVQLLDAKSLIAATASWHERGMYNWPKPPRWALDFLAKYRI